MGKTDALEGLVQTHTVSGRGGIQHPNPFDATVLASSALPQASVSPDAQHLTCLCSCCCCCCWPGPVSSGKCTLLLMATLIYMHPFIYTHYILVYNCQQRHECQAWVRHECQGSGHREMDRLCPPGGLVLSLLKNFMRQQIFVFGK